MVSISDVFWARVSVLQLKKRANLETLRHAVIWSAREKKAMSKVEVSEGKLWNLPEERREKFSGDVMMPSGWYYQVDTLIYDWYKSKPDLLVATDEIGRIWSVDHGCWVVRRGSQGVASGWDWIGVGDVVVSRVRLVEDSMIRDDVDDPADDDDLPSRHV